MTQKAIRAIKESDNLTPLAIAAGTTPRTLELAADGKREITETQLMAIYHEDKRNKRKEANRERMEKFEK